MSGHNGRDKYLTVNREDEILDLKVRGGMYQSFTEVNSITAPGATLTFDNIRYPTVFSGAAAGNYHFAPTYGIPQFLYDIRQSGPFELYSNYLIKVRNETAGLLTYFLPTGILSHTGFTFVNIPAGQEYILQFQLTQETPPAIICTPAQLTLANTSGLYQPLAAALSDLVLLPGTGYVVRTSPVDFEHRTLTTNTPATVTITNPDGVAGNTIIDVTPGAAGVISFEGRNGVVTSAAGDYTASEVTNVPYGSIASVTVQAALNELSDDKQPLATALTNLSVLAGTGLVAETGPGTFVNRDLTTTTPASIQITNPGGVAGNPVIDFIGAPGGVTSFETRTGAVVSAAGDYTASEVTNVPHGSVAAVQVQAAIDELADEKLNVAVMSGIICQDVASFPSTTARSLTTTTPASIQIVNGNGLVGDPQINFVGAAGGVTSFETRTGAVVATAGDYLASEITNSPAGSIIATDVQAAINELDTDKQNQSASLDALSVLPGNGYVVQTGANTFINRSLTTTTPASITITNSNGVAGPTQINFVGATGGVTSFETRTGAVVSANGDYTASEITNVPNFPVGHIVATDVQNAIDELDTEKIPYSLPWTDSNILVSSGGSMVQKTLTTAPYCVSRQTTVGDEKIVTNYGVLSMAAGQGWTRVTNWFTATDLMVKFTAYTSSGFSCEGSVHVCKNNACKGNYNHLFPGADPGVFVYVYENVAGTATAVYAQCSNGLSSAKIYLSGVNLPTTADPYIDGTIVGGGAAPADITTEILRWESNQYNLSTTFGCTWHNRLSLISPPATSFVGAVPIYWSNVVGGKELSYGPPPSILASKDIISTDPEHTFDAEKIYNIQMKTFKYKTDPTESPQLGLIADELTGDSDLEYLQMWDPCDPTRLMSFDDRKLLLFMLRALQKQKSRNDLLESYVQHLYTHLGLAYPPVIV